MVVSYYFFLALIKIEIMGIVWKLFCAYCKVKYFVRQKNVEKNTDGKCFHLSSTLFNCFSSIKCLEWLFNLKKYRLLKFIILCDKKSCKNTVKKRSHVSSRSLIVFFPLKVWNGINAIQTTKIYCFLSHGIVHFIRHL